jgi:hypothetical protein
MPILPNRPDPIEVPDFPQDGTLSKFCEEVFMTIRYKAAALEREADEVKHMRATLIANFGPDGKVGKEIGVTIDNYEGYSPHQLLVLVLKRLAIKAGGVVSMPDPQPKRLTPVKHG